MGEKVISYNRNSLRTKSTHNNRYDQAVVRKISKIDDAGVVYISNPDGLSEKSRARIALGPSSMNKSTSLNTGDDVLVIYENCDPAKPVIVGVITDRLVRESEVDDSTVFEHKEMIFRGKRIAFESSGEVAIQCGDSTIILKNDGKIILKGKEIISRAIRTNKIKGGTVKIN